MTTPVPLFRLPVARACWLIVCWLLLSPVAPAAESRYTAVLSDGTRIEGREIAGWTSPDEKPRLDSTELFSPQRKLVWLRDRTLPAFEFTATSPGWIEFVGGDRLIGRVLGWDEGDGGARQAPPHLVVSLEKPPRMSAKTMLPATARVLPRGIRRVIWGKGAGRPLEPGTLFFLDGRRLSFQNLRWGREGVKVLLDDGVRNVPLAELAEVHLPRVDPWRVYREELAVVNPDLSAPMVRLETTQGLLVTTSESHVRPAGTDEERRQAVHAVQPAWSLDPLWIPLATIRARWQFAAHEVPLSRVAPARFAQRPLLSKGWSWRADCSVTGGPLENAQGLHGWGFGMHAPAELWFDLPEGAQAFRGRAGLDRLAGKGGCVRAAVYVNTPQGTPLYQSKHLVGSTESVDTGPLPLGAAAKQLVLVADAADQGRPAGADPLDIRDAMDWIEPVLVLDRARLKNDVQQSLSATVFAWEGWSAAVDGGALDAVARFVPDEAGLARAARAIGTRGRMLTLTTEREIADAEAWLLIRIRQEVGDAKPGQFEVRVDGRVIARFRVSGRMTSYYVPLHSYQDRQVKLQVVYQPAGDQEQVVWDAVGLGDQTRQTSWSVLTPRETRSLAGSVLTARDDASILAGGPLPDQDVYVVAARSDLPEINAFRVEAFLDDSLPRDGPGRNAQGRFQVTRFSVAAMAAAPPVNGRYVRIEAAKPAKSALALAEVQVFNERENLAAQGKASQSSTEGRATAARAIDNNPEGARDGNSIAQTKAGDPNVWWELDLGGAKRMDRLVLWYPDDRGLSRDYRNFRACVLDPARRPVWQRLIGDVPAPPSPCEELLLAETLDLPLNFLEPRFYGARAEAKPLAKRQPSWTSKKAGLAAVAVYVPLQPFDPRGKVLVFRLHHFSKDSAALLGRFRISATAEKPPFALQSDGVEVPLIPEAKDPSRATPKP